VTDVFCRKLVETCILIYIAEPEGEA